jgi:hypothetical protein
MGTLFLIQNIEVIQKMPPEDLDLKLALLGKYLLHRCKHGGSPSSAQPSNTTGRGTYPKAAARSPRMF